MPAPPSPALNTEACGADGGGGGGAGGGGAVEMDIDCGIETVIAAAAGAAG